MQPDIPLSLCGPLALSVVKLIFAMKHVCPICKKATDSEKDSDFPFCSERCRLQDLGAWASEKYVVSEPIFNEDDLADSEPKTFTVDLDEPNEHKH